MCAVVTPGVAASSEETDILWLSCGTQKPCGKSFKWF